MKLILASASPRRRELLKLLGYDFEIVVSKKEEVFNSKLSLLENSLNISRDKAIEVMGLTEGDRIIISSDTMVVKDDKIYGKPKNRNDAYQMLKTLSGTYHEVYTSLTVIKIENKKKTEYQDYTISKVFVDNLSDDEINSYLDTDEPYDKAGAYAVQGIFSKHINKIEGDYMGIMGLPVNKLYNILKKIM